VGSFSILVVGDDWREQLDEYIDTDTEERSLRCFIGTCDDLHLKLGRSGWVIDRSDTVTAVSGGCAGSARLQDIDFDVVRLEAAELFQWRWDAAHNLAGGELWLPWTEIRKRYPAPGKTEDWKLEKAAKDEWMPQKPLQCIYRARLEEINRSFEPATIDLLLLPRADCIEAAWTNARLVSALDVIQKGEYLRDPDVNAVLAGLEGNPLLTHACVKI